MPKSVKGQLWTVSIVNMIALVAWTFGFAWCVWYRYQKYAGTAEADLQLAISLVIIVPIAISVIIADVWMMRITLRKINHQANLVAAS